MYLAYCLIELKRIELDGLFSFFVESNRIHFYFLSDRKKKNCSRSDPTAILVTFKVFVIINIKNIVQTQIINIFILNHIFQINYKNNLHVVNYLFIENLKIFVCYQ